MVKFAYRSVTNLRAYVHQFGGGSGVAGYGQGFFPVLEAEAGAIGGFAVNMAKNAEVPKVVCWPGFGNLPSFTTRNFTLALRVRFATFAINQRLFSIGAGRNINSISLSAINGTDLQVEVTNGYQDCLTSGTFTAPHGLSSTTDYNDIVVTWDGTTGANSLKLYLNGSLLSQVTPDNPWPVAPFLQSEIILGGSQLNANSSEIYANEIVIFDQVLSGATIASDFAGPSRSAFYNTPALNGLTWPDDDEVLQGTTFNQFGTQHTGTLVVPAASTDPGFENVRDTVSYDFEGVGKTGNYRGQDLWSQVPVDKVLLDTEFLANGDEKLGTFNPFGYTTTLRQFLDNILLVIGEGTLTDLEYSGIDLMTRAYDTDTYNELLAVLDSRAASGTSRTRLTQYFQARGVDVVPPSNGKSNILLGGPL